MFSSEVALLKKLFEVVFTNSVDGVLIVSIEVIIIGVVLISVLTKIIF